MAIKVFITGVTGYIGGDALYTLHQKHPEWEYAALVRSQEKADKVTAAYPKIRIVIGGLDDFETIKKEAGWADIVLHTADASDHAPAAKAIAAGLSGPEHSASRPGFWLHTSGTGILTYFDTAADRLGLDPQFPPGPQGFDDWDRVEELTGLPDEAFHRDVDQIVLGCGTDPKTSAQVKTAVMCPPTIYGPGRGPISGRSRQAYALARLILEKGYAPLVGEGKAVWNYVHVWDLSQAFLLLAEAAAEYLTTGTGVGKEKAGELWGEKGYFLCENGEMVWGDVAKGLAAKAVELGYVSPPPGAAALEEKKLNKQEAFDVADFQALSWGLNSRGKARRLHETLGWTPKGKSIWDEMEDIVKSEKKRLDDGL